jgi:glycosyltransferase involved in cell wall biosynthesis
MDAAPTRQNRVTHEPLAAGLGGLRVALVHDWITGRRGGEKCLEVLCEAFPGATVHTLLHARGTGGPTIESMSIKTSALQMLPGAVKHYRSLLPLMPLAARGWRVGPADLVISLSHCVAKAVRVPAGVPHVCYCFTPMRYAWEGRDAYLQSWSNKPLRRAAAGWMLDRLRRWDLRSARNVTHFVAISETIRDRIAACYGRSSEVIYPPVDVDFYHPASAPRQPFYLVVSALVPYKRVDQAIAACKAFGRPLVIIGEGPERARLQSQACDNVRFLGWQPDEVVRDYMRTCRALLFPGEEDFGIVPVEALACGTPVIALGAGGASESVTNEIGRLYPHPTVASLIEGIREWELRGCPDVSELARRAALRFARSRFRDALLDHLSGVVRTSKSRTESPPRPHSPLTSERGPAMQAGRNLT